MNSRYAPFSSLCVRLPLLSIYYLSEYLDAISKNHDAWILPLEKIEIKNSLYIASPEFYNQLLQYTNGEQISEEKIEKLKITLLKYITRMTTRCTPFGLFAGCSMGDYGDETTVLVKSAETHSLFNRLDMDFLVKLAKKVEQETIIKNAVKWYPNSSLYTLGDAYRYIEYTYEDAKRTFSIEGLRKTETIEKILKYSLKGQSISKIANHIVDEDINVEDATTFVIQLLDSQLLVSELEPKLTQADYLKQLYQVLVENKINSNATVFVENLTNEIATLTSINENWIEKIAGIHDDAAKSNIPIVKKQFLQTDFFLSSETSINKKWGSTINSAIGLLSNISVNEPNPLIVNFKKQFVKRYGDATVPLAIAIDTEAGINYTQRQTPINSEFLKNIYSQENKSPSNTSLPWNEITELLNRKILKATKSKAQCITLKITDFNKKETNRKLPPTVSVFGEILTIDSQEKLYINSIGGSSAANLLARFGNGDEKLKFLLNEITNFEENFYSHAIVAEIVHLPSDRMGNIALRPQCREYEIPYLAQASVVSENQIPINDLLVSVKNNRIVLFSKSKQKEVIPYNSNAHNYTNNTTPIYQFLCEIGSQDYNTSLSFSWGALENVHSFLPRVQFENYILKKARWHIFKEDILKLQESLTDEKILKKHLKTFQIDLNLPNQFQLIQGDNTLAIFLRNTQSVKMLLQLVKNRASFWVEEFLFSDEAIAKNNEGEAYCNQVILPLYKTAE